MHGFRTFIASVMVVSVASAAPAADAPTTDKAALDKLLYDALKDMHNRAADLYNQGDANGCYRMFQGGLVLAKPLLAHRPDVQKVLDDGMLESDKLPSIAHRAVKLHKTIESMRDRLKPAAPVQTGSGGTLPATAPPNTPMPAVPGSSVPPAVPPGSPAPPTRPPEQSNGPTLPSSAPGSSNVDSPPPPPPSETTKPLWDRLGGKTGVEKAVNSFVALLLDADPDKKVNLSRDGKHQFNQAARGDLSYKLQCYISSLSGGPFIYLGKSMLDAHKGMAIKDAEFDEMLKWLKSAFELQRASEPSAIDELLKKVQEARKEIVGK